jgi:Fur family ferric uptake transcriptional regulator
MSDYEILLESFKTLLREKGLKFTRQRELILKTLYEDKEHSTPEDILSMIKEQYPKLNIGIATIYRTLSVLEKSGMVESISFGAKGKKYEISIKAHHDHLLCIKCDRLIEFYDDTIERQQEKIAKEFNFKMTGHTMNIVGICESCQKLQNNTTIQERV